MSTPSKAPTYNLKVVLQETGIKPDTLRAWERRYGLPVPERTPGGHRLYSQYDIEIIKWLQARQEEGLRINRAVDLWRSMQDSGQDPLLVMPIEEVGAPIITGELVSGKTLDEMKDNWISACMAFDEPTAEAILAQARSPAPRVIRDRYDVVFRGKYRPARTFCLCPGYPAIGCIVGSRPCPHPQRARPYRLPPF